MATSACAMGTWLALVVVVVVVELVGGASALSAVRAACELPTVPHTLLGLSTQGVSMVHAADPDACCAACHPPGCMTWSWVGDLWTPETPCHLSPYAPINSKPDANHSRGSSSKAPPAPPGPPGPGPGPDPEGPGSYRVDMSPAGKRQTIWGVGFEIQSDSIGSGNNGMPGCVCACVCACARACVCVLNVGAPWVGGRERERE